MRLEQDAVFVDPAKMLQADPLKSAAVGQDGAVPHHESVQAADLLDQIDAGPQVQMVCVSQQDVGPDGVNVGGIEGFDGTLGRHGHECRRGHVAVGGVECSDASAAVVGFKGERFMMVDNRPDLQKAGLASWPM